MRTIDDHRAMVALCGGDTLCLWAAQGPGGDSRAWVSDDGRGLVVSGPRISQRDRLAVRGPADAVVPLIRAVLPEVGPTYRPLGDPDVVGAVVEGVPELVTGKSFGWMHSPSPHEPVRHEPVRHEPARDDGPGGRRGGRGGRADAVTRRLAVQPVYGAPRWLSGAELAEATTLLEAVFPGSDAMPGVPGVECWAGIRDDAGRLVAVAALAWSAPAVGLITGVAVHRDAQGQGLGEAICRFVLAAALARHGNAALMVDEWNHAAIRLYQRLGMRYRPILAAYVPR
ncbi:MAG: GNAT family N-acetyltransferase [Actinoallomurus sp.]